MRAASWRARLVFALINVTYYILDPDGSLIGHVPDGLAAVLAPLLDSGTVTSVTGTTTDLPRSVAEGVWAVCGGIELSCEYALHGTKKDRSHEQSHIIAHSQGLTNGLYIYIYIFIFFNLIYFYFYFYCFIPYFSLFLSIFYIPCCYIFILYIK